jgi:hypothetical protein
MTDTDRHKQTQTGTGRQVQTGTDRYHTDRHRQVPDSTIQTQDRHQTCTQRHTGTRRHTQAQTQTQRDKHKKGISPHVYVLCTSGESFGKL